MFGAAEEHILRRCRQFRLPEIVDVALAEKTAKIRPPTTTRSTGASCCTRLLPSAGVESGFSRQITPHFLGGEACGVADGLYRSASQMRREGHVGESEEG